MLLSIFFNYEIDKNIQSYVTSCRDNNEYDGIHIVDFIKESKMYESIYQFKTIIDNNIFLTSTLKTFIISKFFIALKKYKIVKNILIRYIHSTKKSYNNSDLCMNPFTNKRHIFYIFNKSNKYTFHLHDLNNIVFNALIHSDEFLFSIPLEIKNPYTNIPFTSNQLYTIYICMQLRGFFIHPLFTLFMQEKFNIVTFSIKHESVIKEFIIENKIKNLLDKKVHEELKYMFDSLMVYNYNTMQHVHLFPNVFINSIPFNILVHFKPLLIHYFHYVYSTNTFYRQLEYNKLLKKLIAFKRENPSFLPSLKIHIPIQNVKYKDITIPRPISQSIIEALMYIPQN